jgi:hypothetical protein
MVKKCMMCDEVPKGLNIICEPCYGSDLEELQAEVESLQDQVDYAARRGMPLDPLDRITHSLRTQYLPHYPASVL